MTKPSRRITKKPRRVVLGEGFAFFRRNELFFYDSENASNEVFFKRDSRLENRIRLVAEILPEKKR